MNFSVSLPSIAVASLIDTVTLTGAVNWAAGSMGHSSFAGGTTILDSAATLSLASASYAYLDHSRVLRNNGTITEANATYQVYVYGGATLDNRGLFDLQSDAGIGHSGATSRFVNNGTLQKSGGTATSTISVAFDNNGTVNWSSGGNTSQNAALVATKDGREHSGMITRETGTELILRTATNEEVSITIRDVARRTSVGSLMPAGLLEGLEAQQLRDFFAYLRISQPISR